LQLLSPQVAPARGAVPLAAGAALPLYELQDVGFSVPGRTLLQPLSLVLQPGRVHALIGPNGSGKSTLVKLLARQQAPSRGTLRFQGRPIADWGSRDFARRVAYLPQFTPPADGMTVRELVALGRFPWHGALGRVTPADRHKVQEALEQTGTLGFADRLVDTLSGGERQRCWLAMLLAQDAGCLLLDEPVSALDIAHQVEVLSLLQRLGRDRALAVVVVLHDVNMAARYCDEILAMGEGTLVARGAPAEIMRPDRLQRIYHLPMGVLPHPATGEAIGFVQ
jgi:iron complex transport system ATP-binding protein